MKIIITLISLTIIIFTYSCKNSQNIIKTDRDSNMYKVTKIKGDKSLYIIYAERNDSIFKIISDKEYEKNCLNSIKSGQYYNLNLSVTFPAESLYGPVGLEYATHISFSFKESVVKTEKKSHYKLYVANNLKGLCLSE